MMRSRIYFQPRAASTHEHEHASFHSRRDGVNALFVLQPTHGTTATSPSSHQHPHDIDMTNMINHNNEGIPPFGRRHDYSNHQHHLHHQAVDFPAFDGLQEGCGLSSVEVSRVVGILNAAGNTLVDTSTRNGGASAFSFTQERTTTDNSTMLIATPNGGCGGRPSPPCREGGYQEEADSMTTPRALAWSPSGLPSDWDQNRQRPQQQFESLTASLEIEERIAIEPTPIGPMGLQRSQLVPHVSIKETKAFRYGTQMSALVSAIFRQQPMVGIEGTTVDDESDTQQNCRFNDKQGDDGADITCTPGKKSSDDHFSYFERGTSSSIPAMITPVLSPPSTKNQYSSSHMRRRSLMMHYQDSAGFQAATIGGFDGAMNATVDAVASSASDLSNIHGNGYVDDRRQKKREQPFHHPWKAGEPVKTDILHGYQQPPPRLGDRPLTRNDDYHTGGFLHAADDDDEQQYGRFRQYQSDQWQARFEELLEFHRQHGHSLVPHRSQNCQLAQWVKRQRYQHKLKHKMGQHSTLSDEREAMLRAIGFCWDSHHAAWMEQYKALIKYRAVHGHCNVPSPQRTSKRGKVCRMVSDGTASSCIESRNNSGTTFVMDKRAVTNDSVGRKLMFSCNDHGVSRARGRSSKKEGIDNSTTASDHNDDPYRSLAVWVKCQRRHYKLFLKNDRRSTMTAERFARLEAIGFDWNPRNFCSS